MILRRHHDLYIENCAVHDIVKQIPTPFYAYSRSVMERNAEAYLDAISVFDDALVCYALKAHNHPAILKLLANKGMGADVVSGFELRQALQAGIPPEKIVFSGVGKTPEEIRLALRSEIHQLNVESMAECDMIITLAAAVEKTAPLAIRINPNVNANTHAKITTGTEDNKFGIAMRDLPQVIDRIQSSAHVQLTGLAVHIGSQILTLAPYRDAYTAVMTLVKDLAGDGIIIDRLDFGGGIGIAYDQGPDFTLQDYTAMVRDVICSVFAEWSGQVIFEPGRSIIGPAGALITEVLYVKDTPKKQFAIVNAAMTDLLRPALYDAVHSIVPIHMPTDMPPAERYDVVGPVCETGDILGRDVLLPPVRGGDVLAVLDAGAYGAVLSSQYNMRSRPAEIMVDHDRFGVITERQDFDALNHQRHLWVP